MSRSHLIVTLLVLMLLSVAGAIIPSVEVFADNRVPYNTAEQNAYNLCYWGTGTAFGARGAIWFTNSASYYNDTVNVSSDAQTVDVSIRGSVYGCKYGSPGDVKAVDVRTDAPNATLLSNLSSTTLSRGTLPSPAASNWSTKGGEITATLNISSVPLNTTSSPVTTTLQVGIYRCFSQNGTKGACYTEVVNVYVTRAGRANSWTSSAATQVFYTRSDGSTGSGSLIDAFPGDKLEWSHSMTISNFTSGASAQNMWDASQRTGSWSGSIGVDQPKAFNSNTSWSITDPFGLYTVTAADIGKNLCQRLVWQPFSYNDSSLHATSDVCARIHSDYNYEPYSSLLDASKRSTISVGDTVATTDMVYRNGNTPETATEWTVYEFVVGKNDPLPNFAAHFNKIGAHGSFAQVSYGGTQTVCDWLSTTYTQVKSTNCKLSKLKNGSNAQGTEIITSDKTIDTEAIATSANVIGEKICRVVAVRHFDYATSAASDTTRRIADPACVLIGQKPLVQVWGNDLRVGSSTTVTTNLLSRVESGLLTVNSGGAVRTFGSWGEYSVLAPSVVASVASGSGLNAAGATSTAASWSRLTFANNTAGLGNFGSGAQIGTVPDIKAYFTKPTIPSGVTRRDVGDVTLTSADYVANQVVYSSGVVTIASSLNAPNGVLTGTDKNIEQFVIIANAIRISQNVRNIDAWLVAPGGVIDTCYEHSEPLTANDCKQDLRVTGPIVAGSLLLKRTFSSAGAPAEVLDMRADTYIWSHRVSATNGVWKTKSITELPPRY